MNKLVALFQLSLADFRERTRRPSFVVTMLGIAFFGYLVITGKYTIQFGEYRTLYDSTWAGSIMAVCAGIMLSLVGFYLVRGSIRRDQRTEVGQIIAATPMSRRAYIVSKFVGNTVLLWFMAGVLAAIAFVTLLIRNEAAGINLWEFFSPFLMITAPAMIFVASVTVLFDTVHWLRGSAGNIIYLFAIELCLVLGMTGVLPLDLGGVTMFTSSVKAAAAAAFPDVEVWAMTMGFVMFDPEIQVEATKTFPWGGIDWSIGALVLRFIWVGAAAVITTIAIPLFDRFDPARGGHRKARKKVKEARAPHLSETGLGRTRPTYSQLEKPQIAYSLAAMAVSELRLTVKGYHWFWYAVAFGLVGAQLAAPFDIVRQFIVPGAMVWPLVIWSSMGTREAEFGTGALLFSSPDPVRRQFPALWLSGLAVALLALGGGFMRGVIAGEILYAAILVASAIFIPTVALTFGTLSGTRRIFEVLYLTFWYMGSVEHVPTVDMLGTTAEAVTPGKILVLGLATMGLLAVSFSARRWQVLKSV